MNRSDTDENSPPVTGASLEETPEATRARLYAWHKENGTLGVFRALYGEKTGRGRDETAEREPTATNRAAMSIAALNGEYHGRDFKEPANRDAGAFPLAGRGARARPLH